jgi:hypothetical protein
LSLKARFVRGVFGALPLRVPIIDDESARLERQQMQ